MREWESWMWDRTRDLLLEAGRIERRLHEIAASALSLAGDGFAPAVDVVESPGALTVLAALAGAARADVSARIEGGALVISGRRNLSGRRAGAPRLLEIPCGPFERRIPLPAGADLSIERAALEDGLLTVTLRRGT